MINLPAYYLTYFTWDSVELIKTKDRLELCRRNPTPTDSLLTRTLNGASLLHKPITSLCTAFCFRLNPHFLEHAWSSPTLEYILSKYARHLICFHHNAA